MSQSVVVQLIDDLDGQDIEDGDGETVRFSVDYVDFEDRPQLPAP